MPTETSTHHTAALRSTQRGRFFCGFFATLSAPELYGVECLDDVLTVGGHAVAQLVEALSRKVVGFIPDYIIGFFELT
jgi:hypothetical protein